MDYNKDIVNRELIYQRILDILNLNQFELSIKYLTYINEYLFKGIYNYPGHIRKYNISKDEDILGGKSADYADFHTICFVLNYNFGKEKYKNYKLFTDKEVVKSVTRFMADIWRVHPFGEGNTRTSSVFIETYLRYLGYDTDNTLFKENAKYVRNALVRANYTDLDTGMLATYRPLELFFNKVLVDNKIELDESILYTENVHIPKKVKKRY